jgi:nicotinamide riboside transporter PnuC
MQNNDHSKRRNKMKTNISIKSWNAILSSALRLLLVVFVIAVLAGLKIPFASGEKAVFIILIHIGVAVSLASNWRFVIGLKWSDPINIIGSILGAAAILVIIYAFKDVDIPLISGYTTAFQVLAILLLIKVGLKMLQERKARHSSESAS